MKKFFVLFILFLCGCSDRIILNCSYVDSSSILGSKKINDVIEFRNDAIISYKRNIDFSLHSDIKDSRSVYRIVKLEGKALKKYIGGKYKMNRSDSIVSMSFSSKKFNNLKYIGIDISYGYDEVLSVYSNLGFVCK